jgi:hypothetical protein
MNAHTANVLLIALRAALQHLEYCGYGDSWERELAYNAGLPKLIEQAIKVAELYQAMSVEQ